MKDKETEHIDKVSITCCCNLHCLVLIDKGTTVSDERKRI